MSGVAGGGTTRAIDYSSRRELPGRLDALKPSGTGGISMPCRGIRQVVETCKS